MKTLLIITLLFLCSCTTTSVTVTDDDGRDWDIKYTAFGNKNLQNVNATVGLVKFSIGSSSQDTPTMDSKLLDSVLSGKLVPAQQRVLSPPNNAEVIYEAGIKQGMRSMNNNISSYEVYTPNETLDVKADEAGNVWINDRINPQLPLKQK